MQELCQANPFWFPLWTARYPIQCHGITLVQGEFWFLGGSDSVKQLLLQIIPGTGCLGQQQCPESCVRAPWGCCGQTKPCSAVQLPLMAPATWDVRNGQAMLLLQAACLRKAFSALLHYSSGPRALGTFWGDTKHLETPHPSPGFFGSWLHLQECSQWPWQHPKCSVPQPPPPPLMSVLLFCPHIQLSHAHVPKSDRGTIENPGKATGMHIHVLPSPSFRPSLSSKLLCWGVFNPLPFYSPHTPELPMFTDTIQAISQCSQACWNIF